MNELVKAFYNVYNKADNISIVKSPLRICPLGAHIDHQDGMVTGMALDSSVIMVYAPGNDGFNLIKYSHWVETNYIGLKNGILDQASNILSKEKV